MFMDKAFKVFNLYFVCNVLLYLLTAAKIERKTGVGCSIGLFFS
jgi:hypothetical protein